MSCLFVNGSLRCACFLKGVLAHEVPKIFLVSFFLFFLPLHVSMCVCRLNTKFEGKKKRRLQATVIFILTPPFHFVSLLHVSCVVLYEVLDTFVAIGARDCHPHKRLYIYQNEANSMLIRLHYRTHVLCPGLGSAHVS